MPLSEKGIGEAKQGGKLLKDAGFEFDIAYTSYLKVQCLHNSSVVIISFNDLTYTYTYTYTYS